jgi:hypothetical protein
MPAPYSGGCLCGLIRYRLADEPLTLYACHCTDCQRQSGSSFGLSMIVSRTALDLLQGEPRHHEVTLADGRQKNGTFCGVCATRIWSEPVKFPQVVNVEPGTLDDTSWLRPIAHIWTRSAQPWVAIPPGTLTFEGQPTDPMALINAWWDRSK